MNKYAQYSKSARIGVGLVVAVLLAFTMLFSKDSISSTLLGGKEITATFSQDYKLRDDVSKVKVGFVPVGKVVGIERDEDGNARVTMKVDNEVADTLGTKPTATIRATTALGGNYFVDLQAGGTSGEFNSDEIPLARTKVPVELDKIARALQPSALEGAQSTVDVIDKSLDADGQQALRRLLRTSPATLKPATRVLDAAQGESKRDLTYIVSGMQSLSTALTQRDGQAEAIVNDLEVLSRTLDSHRDPLGETVDDLPDTLTTARNGLADLDTALTTLRDVSPELVPVVRELDTTLEKIQPVLTKARPVVRDARGLVHDARPSLNHLVPESKTLDNILTDVDGPVLERLNGPVTTWLYEPYKPNPKAGYPDTESDKPTYQEMVYALANVARASSTVDKNGHMISFQAAPGAGTVSGLPGLNIENLIATLMRNQWPDQPIGGLPLTTPNSDSPLPGTNSGVESGAVGSGSNPPMTTPDSVTSMLDSDLLSSLLGGSK